MDDLARFWPGRLDLGLRDRLLAAYDDPARSYHDRRHLVEVLGHVDDLAHDAPFREAVLLAAWFHDAVYDGRADDEERSARLAEESLPPGELADEVARLVRLTRTHRPAPDDLAGAVLCDADLAVLASDESRYADYVQAVRREHAHVEEPDFTRGRLAVLEDLLAKPTLFGSTAAQQRWELRARANLEGEVSRLRG